MAAKAQLAEAISNFLVQRAMPPTQVWLDSFIASVRQNSPLPALQKTALFRLLASDITTSIQSNALNTLPQNALDPQVKQQILSGPLVLQVLDVEDIGRSRWSQLEALEAHARGESTRGRQVIRVIPADMGENGTAATNNISDKNAGPHKLLLQDALGRNIYAFELTNVQGIDSTMSIGTKLILRRATIARGVIMLDPACVDILGGKVESWDKAWRDGRTQALRAKVGATDDD